ncbi:MAG: purine-nucleoside phosphorylase [Pirellulales bacterium]
MACSPALKSVPSTQACVDQVAALIQSRRLLQPQVAIVLGSGLGGLADELQHVTAIQYAELPYFQATHAAGHAGRLLLGYLGGVPVVVMQGRYHRYEGHDDWTVTFPVRVMQALGAGMLLVTNAAGGLNPRYRPGDLMLIDQHIDHLWTRPQACRGASAIPCTESTERPGSAADCVSPHAEIAPAAIPLRKAEIYDHALGERLKHIALTQQLHLQRGTYVATLGPTYETRAEYRMFRTMGGDAVGMSTVPEVLTARSLGMRVLALSVITNVACTDTSNGTSHDEVVACGKQVGPRLKKLFTALLEQMSGPAD